MKPVVVTAALQLTQKDRVDLFFIDDLKNELSPALMCRNSRFLCHLTGRTMIKVVVESVVEKHQQLPEAPTSITVKAIYKGFDILFTRRSDDQSVIPLVPGVVALIDKLIAAGFQPSREIYQAVPPAPETKELGKENLAPICAVHNKPMIWREGNNKQTSKHYAFWACPERNTDGSFCKYKPEKK